MPQDRAVLRYAAACVHGAEGYREVAYLDMLAKPPRWTIGFGTTRIGNRPVRQGDVCTKSQAEAWAAADMWAALSYVRLQVVVALDDWQAAALTSLVYNVGMGHFHDSSVLAALNEARYYTAADCFLEYDHAGGVRIAGLTKRRERERAMFLCQMPPMPPVVPPLSEADTLNERELQRIAQLKDKP